MIIQSYAYKTKARIGY